MKFLFILLFSFHFLKTSADWVQQNSQTTFALNSVNFINAQTGFAAGDNGVIRKTSDGGNTWTIVESPLAINFNYLKMFGENNVVLVSLTSSKVLRTTNAGVNWLSTDMNGINQSYTKSKVQFIDSLTGFIIAAGLFCHTTNGGSNWVQHTTPSSFRDFSMLDANTGWICGSYTIPFPPPSGTSHSRVMKTFNGGNNWTSQVDIPEMSFAIYRIFAINSNLAFYNAFQSGSLVRTIDGGDTWNAGTAGAGDYKNYYNYSFPTSNTGWLIGDFMLKTTNSAANWSIMTTPFGNSFKSVFFIDENTGWFTGNGGLIVKTTTGGITGVNSTSLLTPAKYALYQNYPNPFNPNTNIHFDLKKREFIQIKVYNSLGTEVETIVNEVLNQGSYNISFRGENLSSGIYYYRMKTESFADTKKMILVK